MQENPLSMVTIPEETLKAMEKKVRDLKTLTELSTIISSTLDLKELMPLVMEKAKQVLGAEACSILFYDKEQKTLEFEVAVCDEEQTSDTLKKKISLQLGQGIAGWVAQHMEPLFIDDVTKDSRFFQGADRATGFQTRSIIAVPLIGRSGLIGVAEIVNAARSDYDMEIFQLLCRQFAIAIENSIAYRESVERERLKQELEIASVLQRSFLPESPAFRLGGLSAAAVNLSAAQVGGDIYDFVVPAEGRAGMFIGDVSGKGVSAALYMAKVSSDFRYIAGKEEDPGQVLDRLNTVLLRYPRGMFLTAIYLIVDVAMGTLSISVAGHPPFLWVTGGDVRVMSVPAGPPLGIIPHVYTGTPLSLKRGDRLILLTDGVFDAKNPSGQRLGFESLVRFVKEHAGKDRLSDMIVDYVKDYAHGAERADDLTIVEMAWGEA